MVLIDIKEGEKCLVSNIASKNQHTIRLYELGFIRNVEIIMFKNDTGPLILSINGSRVAIGRALSRMVNVIKI
jgi:Fe2+ transport system protein FeoA